MKQPMNERTENTLPPQPRLQIIHLLLWTAGTALVLATWRHGVDAYQEYPSAIRLLMLVQLVFHGPLEGAAVASLGVWAYRARKGIPFPVSPGEWTLVVYGVKAVAWAVMATLWRGLFGSLSLPHEGVSLTVWLVLLSCIHLLEAGLFLTATVHVRTAPAWRLFLAGQAVHAVVAGWRWAIFGLNTQLYFPVLQFLEQAAALIANAIACICFVLLILAVVRDWRQRTPRGWMHWVGVVTALVSMVMGAAWIVVPQVIS